MDKARKGVFSFSSPEWKDISQEAKNLISNMLQKDTSKRFSAQQCLDDPWFKKNIENVEIDRKQLSLSLNNLQNFRSGKKL